MKRNMLTDLLIIILLCLIVFAVCVAVYPMRKVKIDLPEETIEPTHEIENPPPAPAPAPEIISESTEVAESTPYVFHSENIPLSAELQAVLYDSCLENWIDIYIALGLIEYESNFQTDLYNGKVQGLMQLNIKYFPANLSPADNIRYGLNYLGKLLKQYGDYPVALTVYDFGHYTDSRKYANVVMSKAEKWRNLV